MHAFIVIVAMVFLQEVPLKPKDEFDVKLDFEFRRRALPEKNTVLVGGTIQQYGRHSTGVLPYLKLHITLFHLREEKMRMRITTNLDDRLQVKKVEAGEVVELDLGFTDDMVDRVTAHRYILTFLGENKRPVDRIVINIDEDGRFFINGEERGKF